MAEVNIDFEGSAQPSSNNAANNAPNTNPAAQQDTTPIDGNLDVVDVNNSNPPKDNNKPEEKPHDLETGTEVEFEGTTYTVAENGDIVDKDGNVFKEAKDVKSWLEENNANENNNDGEISLNAIKEAIGVDITDENGKSVEFTNDAAGVKSYVDSVIELKSNELQQGAINKLYSDNPLLKQFVDYVKLTGTPRGFGEIPDRSGIVLDKDNEAQLEAVIKMAAQEFGNKSINDNYIKYLKSTGALYDTAQEQLDALVEKDKQVRKDIETRANQAREEEYKAVQQYWQDVNNAITNRRIGEYLLPETIVKEKNGQKITYTLNDFFDYLSRETEVDEDGNKLTAYRKDLDKLSAKETLDRELLDAWLMFTGGSYKDLIDMAVKEDKVRKLVIKSKQQKTTSSVKISKPASGTNNNANNVVFE